MRTEQNGSGSADHLPSGCTFPREATAKAASDGKCQKVPKVRKSAKNVPNANANANSNPFPDAPKNKCVGRLSVLDPGFMLPGMPAWPGAPSQRRRSVDATCQRTSPSGIVPGLIFPRSETVAPSGMRGFHRIPVNLIC